jgi:ABC-type transport system involved in multi-copper enzyme maturation permease subunit
MLPLFQAEWKKVTGNRRLACCLVWIFPAAGCVFVGLLTLTLLLSSSERSNYLGNPTTWTSVAITPWQILNNPFGRLVIMAFAASVFASEYEHRTWKTILPGNRRLVMILVKYGAFAAFILLAFSIMMVLLTISIGLLHLVIGADYPPALTADVLTDFLGDLFLNAILAFVSTMIVATIAALVALRTQSILYGVMAGVFVSLLEFIGLPAIFLLASAFLGIEDLLDLVVLTPSFNTSNIESWVNSGHAVKGILGEETLPTLSLVTSILILGVWLVSLVGASIALFQQQDIQ